jgi:hypothetical protein
MFRSKLSITIAWLVVTAMGSGCQAEGGQGSDLSTTGIGLGKYCTAQLTNSLNSPDNVKENNLATFPKGRQMFLGVPFQVDCVLQLTGKKVQEWGRMEFPEAIRGIQIGKACSKLYLLHGAGGVFDADGVTIGKLVLHYADQSVREIEIKNGVHVRDWWGDPKQTISATNSALVWTGSNPALKQYGGEKPGSLRIYMTRFNNPQPDLSVTSLDYASAMENSSPFLLALTIE